MEVCKVVVWQVDPPDWLRYMHDGLTDKYPYPHDRRADKDSYPHDRNVTDDLCSLIKLYFAFTKYQPNVLQ